MWRSFVGTFRGEPKASELSLVETFRGDLERGERSLAVEDFPHGELSRGDLSWRPSMETAWLAWLVWLGLAGSPRGALSWREEIPQKM